MDLQALISVAKATRDHAYAPYSHYSVGAAVLADSGRIYGGCNIENASYGLTICAERVACCNAIAAGEHKFLALAIAGGDQVPAMPCGACRQFVAEWAAPTLPIVAVSSLGQRVELTLGDLLPHAFGPQSLQEGD